MLKVDCILTVEFVKIQEEEDQITLSMTAPFRTKTHLITSLSNEEDIEEITNDILFEISGNVDKFMDRGSGWAVHDILSFDVEIVECRPLEGSCSLHSICYVRNEGISWTAEGFDQSCEEEQKDEVMCFYLAVASHFVGKEGEKKPDLLHAFIRQKINTSEKTPVRLSAIKNFENKNADLDHAIQVLFKDEDNEMFPVYISKNVCAKNQIVLMLGFIGKEDFKMHFAYMDKPEKLLAPRRKDKGGTHTDSIHFCFNCFGRFYRKETFQEHVKWCHTTIGRIERMPEKGDTMSFISEHKTIPVGLVMFIDIEAAQIKPQKSACSCSKERVERREKIDAMEEKDRQWEMLRLNFEDSVPKKLRGVQPCTHDTKVLSAQPPVMASFASFNREN